MPVPKSDCHLEVGRAGEAAARAYLQRRGYVILEQNYRKKRAEVDLIAKQGGELVFVEVRTRRDGSLGPPEETFTKEKLRRLRRHAEVYLAWRGWRCPCRIDAACVVLAPGRWGRFRVTRLTHYENITA